MNSDALAAARPGDTAAESTRKLRVCLVVSEYPPAVGGLGKSAYRIAGWLARSGVDVHVFTPTQGDQGRPIVPLPQDGVTVHEVEIRMLLPATSVRGLRPWLAARPSRFWRQAPQLRTAIAQVAAEHPFDVIHGFGLWVAVPCRDVARDLRIPLVLSIRGADGIELPYRPSWISAVGSAAWITSVSNDSLTRAGKLIDIEARSSFVPNGVDQTSLPRWELTASNAGVVGTVAAFREKKNLPLLIDAYSLLPRASRKRLLLVGGFASKWGSTHETGERFKNYVEERHLSHEVEMTGMVPNERVAARLQSMRAFALSSDHEGLPNSVLEAAAVGVPIVATAVDGVKDVFTDGTNALLVPPRDPEALARALRRVLEDAELALSLSRAGLELASTLTVQAECSAYVKLYRNVIG